MQRKKIRQIASTSKNVWKPLPEMDDARDAEVYIHPRHFNSYLEKLCVWNNFFAIGEKNRTLVLKHCEKKISTAVHHIYKYILSTSHTLSQARTLQGKYSSCSGYT